MSIDGAQQSSSGDFGLDNLAIVFGGCPELDNALSNGDEKLARKLRFIGGDLSVPALRELGLGFILDPRLDYSQYKLIFNELSQDQRNFFGPDDLLDACLTKNRIYSISPLSREQMDILGKEFLLSPDIADECIWACSFMPPDYLKVLDRSMLLSGDIDFNSILYLRSLSLGEVRNVFGYYLNHDDIKAD